MVDYEGVGGMHCVSIAGCHVGVCYSLLKRDFDIKPKGFTEFPRPVIIIGLEVTTSHW